jgi:hypothetical protein
MGSKGSWTFLFLFQGTPLWILLKMFCHQLSPRYKNVMQIKEIGANHM